MIRLLLLHNTEVDAVHELQAQINHCATEKGPADIAPSANSHLLDLSEYLPCKSYNDVKKFNDGCASNDFRRHAVNAYVIILAANLFVFVFLSVAV
jgi:hypothetical protein